MRAVKADDENVGKKRRTVFGIFEGAPIGDVNQFETATLELPMKLSDHVCSAGIPIAVKSHPAAPS